MHTSQPDEMHRPVLERQQPIPSEQLFRAQDEVRIMHQGTEYRLRKTRAGKLILTK